MGNLRKGGVELEEGGGGMPPLPTMLQSELEIENANIILIFYMDSIY